MKRRCSKDVDESLVSAAKAALYLAKTDLSGYVTRKRAESALAWARKAVSHLERALGVPDRSTESLHFQAVRGRLP